MDREQGLLGFFPVSWQLLAQSKGFAVAADALKMCFIQCALRKLGTQGFQGKEGNHA